MTRAKTRKPKEGATERALKKLSERLESADSEKWIAHYIKNPRIPRSLNSQESGKPRPYRGANTLILSLTAAAMDESAEYTDFWLSYRQAQSRGGHVKRGESGTTILVPKPVKIKEKKEDADEEERTRLFMSATTVFNTAQTEGCDFSDIEKYLSGEKYDHADAAFDGVEEALRICREMPNPPEFEERMRIIPHYTPSKDTVSMLPIHQFDSPANHALTMLHEYAHSTGHPSRLSRAGFDLDESFRLCDRAAEEMAAETAAVMLSAHVGLVIEDLTENSARYVRSWSQRLQSEDGRKDFLKAATQAQRIVDYILNGK